MKKETYVDLRNRQQKEMTDFPMAFAFNEKQLEEALKKLGAEKSECVTVFEIGDVVRKKDVKALLDMTKRHTRELHNALKDEKFAEDAFLYEMDNHEYAINWDGDADVLGCFCLTEKKLQEMNLVGAYSRARGKHMKHAEECGVI